jgi:glycosyltransferase involved in cell wall biosynthesis
VRICLCSQEYPPGYVGGIGTQCRVKARGLRALRHEVEVLTAGDGAGPMLVTRDDDGVPVHELDAPGREFDVYRTETYWVGYTWAVLGALRSLGATRPFDVIDFPDYAAEGFAFQLDRQEDDPTAVVVHLHGSLGMFSERIGWPEATDRLHRVGIFMEDLAMQAADRLLAASHSIAELTATRTGISLDLLDVVEGAVDTEVFSPPPRPRPPREELRLLFVGNVVANKGVWTVLDAFLRLAPQNPGLTLWVAGRADDGIDKELRARVTQAGLGERVTLLGFVEHEQLPELYRSADMLVVPSHYEGGLGMAYLEAMACGLPVIAGAAGGAAEAIQHDRSGILLQTGGAQEAAEAAAAIQRLLGDPELRARLGAAARASVRERFSMERYATRVAEGYERAIERRRASLVVW